MKYVCLTLQESKREEYANAMSDFLCWLDGFKAGGGTYSPGSENVLRDLNCEIKRAYQTIPAKGEKES